MKKKKATLITVLDDSYRSPRNMYEEIEKNRNRGPREEWTHSGACSKPRCHRGVYVRASPRRGDMIRIGKVIYRQGVLGPAHVSRAVPRAVASQTPRWFVVTPHVLWMRSTSLPVCLRATPPPSIQMPCSIWSGDCFRTDAAASSVFFLYLISCVCLGLFSDHSAAVPYGDRPSERLGARPSHTWTKRNPNRIRGVRETGPV